MLQAVQKHAEMEKYSDNIVLGIRKQCRCTAFFMPFFTLGGEIMGKKFLATTATGIEIYIGEDTLEHLKAHSDLKFSDIAEAVSKVTWYNAPFGIDNVDLGRVVGKDRCVEVAPETANHIQMRTRKGRKGKTPILLEKEGFAPADTSKMVVGICKDREDGIDTLFTAFYGILAPREPWDEAIEKGSKEEAESVEFWRTHALVVSDDDLAD